MTASPLHKEGVNTGIRKFEGSRRIAHNPLLFPLIADALVRAGKREAPAGVGQFFKAVVLLSYKLTEKDVAAIEKGLNKGGKTEVVVRVVKEQLEVVLHEKKKIS